VGMRWLLGILVVICFGTVASAAPAPQIHVSVPTIGIDDAERACHADAIRRVMKDAVRDAGIDAKSVDVTVSKLAVVIGEDKVEISAEIKVVISTTDDQLRSFGSGTARFEIARRQFRPARVAALRHQVLNDALDGLYRRMRATPRRVA